MESDLILVVGTKMLWWTGNINLVNLLKYNIRKNQCYKLKKGKAVVGLTNESSQV